MDTALELSSQLELSFQAKQTPPDHLEPDFYIDPNCCTLEDAVRQQAIDGQADIPLIIWLLENPNSPIALPSKINLYGHDCLHAILNRGHSPADEAFIIGFTMGNNTRTSCLQQLFFKLIASTVYPKKYRLSWNHLLSFDLGFIYGRSIQTKNLNQLDFSTYQNHTVSQVRQQLGVSKSREIALFQSLGILNQETIVNHLLKVQNLEVQNGY